MPAQCDQFHEALEGEDGDESHVYELQGILLLLRLAVRLARHADHVQYDYQHDPNVEHLVPDQLEDEELEL